MTPFHNETGGIQFSFGTRCAPYMAKRYNGSGYKKFKYDTTIKANYEKIVGNPRLQASA
jgi:hypothetical protein